MTAPTVAPLLSGSLRELALADVLQLLELGRKSGVLRVHATAARGGTLHLRDGFVADARLAGTPDGTTPSDDELRDAACALLDVRAGTFTFAPDEPGQGSAALAPRMRVEALLVDAARRADEWARLAAWVSGPDAVPALAASGAGAPDDAAAEAFTPSARQWALLSEVDGVRGIATLAAALGRDALAVAADCSALVRAGLLRCDEGAIAPLVPSGTGRSSLA